MQVLLVILSLGLLGLIVYFAFSPKSSKLLRLSAIIALGFIGLSIGVCVFLLIKGPGQDPTAIPLPVFQDMPTVPAKKSNIPAIVIFVIALLVIIGMIVVGVRRDKTDIKEPASENIHPSVFTDNDDLGLGDEPMEPMVKDNDDSFDIDI